MLDYAVQTCAKWITLPESFESWPGSADRESIEHTAENYLDS